MNKNDLINIFELAQSIGEDIYVATTLPGQIELDYTITKNANLDYKLNWYCNHFDDEGINLQNNLIQIVDAGCINFDFQKEKEN